MSRLFLAFCLFVLACTPWVVDSPFIACSLASGFYIGDALPKDYQAAFQFYRKAASQGDGMASFQVGLLYYLGEGVEKDPKAAVHWWRRGAYLGDAKAQSALGDAYCLAIGVWANADEAQHWWRLAASHGDRHATEMLNSADCKGRHGLSLGI